MKQIFITLIKLAVSLGLLYFVLTKYDLQAVIDSLFQAKLMYLLLALGLFAVFTVMSAWRLYLVFTLFSKAPIAFSRVLKGYLIGSTYNIVLPTAIGGDVARAYYLRTPDHSLKRTAFLSVIDRALGLGFLIVLGILALVMVKPDLNQIATQMDVGQLSLFLLLGFLAGIAIIIALIYVFKEKTTLLLKQMAQISPIGLAKLFTVSLVVQFVAVALTYSLGLAFGIQLSFVIYMLLVPVISVIVVLPISIGGIGLREISSVTLFTFFGAAGPAVVAMSLVQYAYLLIAAGAGGLVLFWTSLNQISQLVGRNSTLPSNS